MIILTENQLAAVVDNLAKQGVSHNLDTCPLKQSLVVFRTHLRRVRGSTENLAVNHGALYEGNIPISRYELAGAAKGVSRPPKDAPKLPSFLSGSTDDILAELDLFPTETYEAADGDDA